MEGGGTFTKFEPLRAGVSEALTVCSSQWVLFTPGR